MKKNDKRENIVVSLREISRYGQLIHAPAHRFRATDIRESRLARNSMPDLRHRDTPDERASDTHHRRILPIIGTSSQESGLCKRKRL